MRYNEKKGHWPFMKATNASSDGGDSGNISSSEDEGMTSEKKGGDSRGVSTKVRSIDP